MAVNPTVAELIARSNRLGADPKNTNYAGGNTSAKGTETDPVTGEPVELLWVKGSGGDLGTLTESGLAVLRLDRMRALVDVYPGVEREDEMVAAFDVADVVSNPARFDQKKADAINAEHVRLLAPEDFRDRLVPYLHRAGLVAADSYADLRPEHRALLDAGAPLVQERMTLLGEAPGMLGFLFVADDAVVLEPDAVVASARHWGAQARIGYAEAFAPTRMVMDLAPVPRRRAEELPAAHRLVPTARLAG